MKRLLQFSFLLAATLSLAQGPPPRIAPTGKPPEKSAIKKTGDVTYEIGDVQLNSATSEIRFPCTVNMREGLAEYALVAETGKTHESLLKTKVKPFDVQIALLLCRYEPHPGELIGFLVNAQSELAVLAKNRMNHPGANLVKLAVEWKDKDGKMQKTALESWIHSERENKSLDIPHWIFNGADPGDGTFAAETEGSFISVHFDLTGIIGSPSSLTGQDDNWTMDTEKIPPLDTAVTLIITPAKPDALKLKK